MRLLSIIIGLAFLLVIAGSALAEQVVDDSKNQMYLLTLASTSGSFEGDILTLEGVPLVVYFSDRPVRKAGHMSLESFLEMWDNGKDNFKNDPPNAGLAMYQENGDKHSVFVISNPEVKGDEISFKVELLNLKEGIPKTLGHSTLFIDNFRVVGGRS